MIEGPERIVTCNPQGDIYQDHHLLLEDGIIAAFLPQNEPKPPVERVINGRGCNLFPGLINTHHHLFQVFTRNIAPIQNQELFPWLQYLYPIWAQLTPEMEYIAALVGLGELVKGGVTTTVDHHYLFPKGTGNTFLQEEIRAAQKLGIRFHPCRGSMSLSQEKGGLPPQELVETQEEILKDSQHIIETYHDPRPSSRCQVMLAPCSPFSVTGDLMKATRELARCYQVFCHTHLAETLCEVQYCQERFGLRPLAYMESLDWLGEDVFFAHGIHFNQEELTLLSETGTGISHSPISNQKLAAGRAPVEKMLSLGIPVGLGVDGSASNDASNMIQEMKAAFLLHRHALGMESPRAHEILAMATQGGSQLLGRDDIGSIEKGKQADLVLLRVDGIEYAGGIPDPVWSLINCGLSQKAEYTLVGGDVVVEKGNLVGVDEEKLAAVAWEYSQQLCKEV